MLIIPDKANQNKQVAAVDLLAVVVAQAVLLLLMDAVQEVWAVLVAVLPEATVVVAVEAEATAAN